jgi:hypothetical protein
VSREDVSIILGFAVLRLFLRNALVDLVLLILTW